MSECISGTVVRFGGKVIDTDDFEWCQQVIDLGVGNWHTLNLDAKEILLKCLNNTGNAEIEPCKKLNYYKQAIDLAIDEWSGLTDVAKQHLLSCLFNAGVTETEPSKQFNYYKQAINLAIYEWSELTDNAKEGLLFCLYNAGATETEPSKELNYYKQAINLAINEWVELTGGAKQALLSCLYNAGVTETKPSKELNYYKQAINLAINEWSELTYRAKGSLLSCLYNAGVTETESSKELEYYNQAIDLAIDEWSGLIDGAKGSLLGCLLNAGITETEPSRKLEYWNKAIGLASDEWSELTSDAKGRLLSCLYNVGKMETEPSRQLNYYKQAINLAIDEWSELTVKAKQALISCLYNAGVTETESSRQLNYYKQAINLAIDEWSELTYSAKGRLLSCFLNQLNLTSFLIKRLSIFNSVLFFSLHNIVMAEIFKKNILAIVRMIYGSLPQFHTQAAQQFAHYLIADLKATEIPWIFPKHAALIASLSEGLIAQNLSNTHKHSQLIQQLQQPNNTATDTLVNNYSTYLYHTNSDWQNIEIKDFGTLTLTLLADKDAPSLSTLITTYLDGYDTLYTQDAKEAHKQRIKDLDWTLIEQEIDLEDEKEHPQTALYGMFISYPKFKFGGDCANNNQAKERWLNKWIDGSIIDSIYDSLQYIPFTTIQKIADYASLFYLKAADIDKDSRQQAIFMDSLKAWLLNDIQGYFKQHLTAYTQRNTNWQTTLFNQLPVPQGNLNLIKALQDCHQHLIKQWIQDNDVQNIWRSLELARLGMNLKYLTAHQLNIVIDTDDQDHIKRALQTQATTIANKLQDPDFIAYAASIPKDAVTGIDEDPIVDPWLVLKALEKGYKEAGAQLNVISVQQVQESLGAVTAVVQLWQDEASVHALILTKDDLYLTTLIPSIDVSDWEAITTNTANNTDAVDIICPQMVTLYQQLAKHVDSKQLVLLPDDRLATLPWHRFLHDNDMTWQATDIELIVTITSWYYKQNKKEPIQARITPIMSRQVAQSAQESIAHTEYHDTHLLAGMEDIAIGSKDLLANGLSLLQQLTGYEQHHLIAHGMFDQQHPAMSKIQISPQVGSQSDLYAWQLASSEVAGEITLSVCQSLVIGKRRLVPERIAEPTPRDELLTYKGSMVTVGQERVDKVKEQDDADSQIIEVNYGYLGAMGLGAGLSAAGAQVVVGSVWKVNTYASYVFNHYWYEYRQTCDSTTALLECQDRVRQITKSEVLGLLKRQYDKVSDDLVDANVLRDYMSQVIEDIKSMQLDEDAQLFADPAYWLGYSTLGFADQVGNEITVSHPSHWWVSLLRWLGLYKHRNQ